MTDDGPVHAGPSSARNTGDPTHSMTFDMKKTPCAMKATLGLRGIAGGCPMWRWVLYHTL